MNYVEGRKALLDWLRQQLIGPAHVLLTIEDCQKLAGGHASIVDLLAMPGTDEIEFEPPGLRGDFHRPADLD